MRIIILGIPDIASEGISFQNILGMVETNGNAILCWKDQESAEKFLTTLRRGIKQNTRIYEAELKIIKQIPPKEVY